MSDEHRAGAGSSESRHPRNFLLISTHDSSLARTLCDCSSADRRFDEVVGALEEMLMGESERQKQAAQCSRSKDEES